ncbi:hypothetical protein AM352_24235 (plasmid) [Citrobacter koseri]|uniref:hypothetical protein n=1 Tax=Citrobacter koseri TaxID=545 RepID=UPI000CE67ED5|nr:hypothetical protein [Citrobacter koseri]AVE61443.1 hypothetical protein AM352_24235 [Citrobacter koseri]
MGSAYYFKNFLYALLFYSITFIAAGWNLELTNLEISVFIFIPLFGSLMYPFSLFFVNEKIGLLTASTFNFVNWGFIVCILLSLPPLGFIFMIYYLIENKKK